MARLQFSVNSGIESEFQLSSEKPLSSDERSSTTRGRSSCCSTAERLSSTAECAASIARSASTHWWYLSSCSVTLSAVSGTSKPIRSRYLDSRMSVVSCCSKLTTIAQPGVSGGTSSVTSSASSLPSSSTATLRTSLVALKMGCLSSSIALALTVSFHSSKSAFS